jgi:adenosine deaminase
MLSVRKEPFNLGFSKMSASMIDRSLPLIDLHRHIDGNVRLATILELGKKHGVKLPGATIDQLRPHVQVIDRQPGVMAFISKMLWMSDLAGDEAKFPPALFVEHFRRRRDAGWRITVHADENAGPQSVWDAIKLLGAERIGHGVRAMEDPALVDFLVEKRIGIEANLTSNVQTSTVTDLASHPLREMLERGLVASLNTDDPGASAIDLPHEFDIAAPAAGLSREQIRQTQINALETSFLSNEEKSTLRTKTASRAGR